MVARKIQKVFSKSACYKIYRNLLLALLVCHSGCECRNDVFKSQAEDPSKSQEEACDAQVSDQKAAVYLFHGLNVGKDYKEIIDLKDKLQISFPNAQIHSVDQGEEEAGSEMRGCSLPKRAEKAFSKIIRTHDNTSPILLIGHSAGGVVAVDVASQLKDQGKNIAGIVTMNAPVGGVKSLESTNQLVKSINKGIVSILGEEGEKDLLPQSAYLTTLSLKFQKANCPMLAIASTCGKKLSQDQICKELDNMKETAKYGQKLKQAFTELVYENDGKDVTSHQDMEAEIEKIKKLVKSESNPLQYLENSDAIIQKESQLAAVNWGNNKVESQFYPNHAHGDIQETFSNTIIAHVVRQLFTGNAKSIFQSEKMYDDLTTFMNNSLQSQKK